MIRNRVFLLLASSMFASAAAIVACSSSDEREVFVEETDSSTPEASLPPSSNPDAGVEDASPTDDADAIAPIEYDASAEAVTCSVTPCVTQLVAGDKHFCALVSDGTVRCWGTDTKGSLGRGDAAVADAGATPSAVVGLTGVKQISIASSSNVTCVVDSQSRLQCWGENGYAQLGLTTPYTRDQNPHPTPAPVALDVDVARVDVIQQGACATAKDGKLYCWGSNDTFQLARPGYTNYYGDPALADMKQAEVTNVTGSDKSIFAMTKAGGVIGWGRPSGRDSSLGTNEGTPIPTSLPALLSVTSLATSGSGSGNVHQCAIAGGRVLCWGSNALGVLGTGVPDSERLPRLAGILPKDPAFPQQLALSPNRTCARMTDGTIQCCGDNKVGQLGRGATSDFEGRFGLASAFVDHAVVVATSTNATCALVQGGKVECWGGNANGELGQGTTDSDPHPTPVTVVFE
ncbi:hypothetical protein AKJ09_01508 [Labilithrix luteola]|uniref:BNR repeat domain protein n=1 Tax=Labilithrix luteola TaxID=1391654 RepID=A0A0K1PP01_9BACT|nr:hypothetical protein [Labilithrix luteola]AKU94844.1 hypothetical protein AKJ09_01508 [Labilithrix luteola]